MNSEQNTYLSDNLPDKYSIREWALAEYPSDLQTMEDKWTREVLPFLKHSSKAEHVCAYNRLAKTKKSKRSLLFQAVIDDMAHADALKPFAAIEKLAVARQQAESISRDLSTLTETSNKKRRTMRSATPPFTRTNQTLHNPLQLTTEVGSKALQDILYQFNKVACQAPKPKPWTLSSGTVVDNKLISYAQSLKAENAALSFIFDTSNHDIMRLFTLDEQQEILKTNHTNISNDRHLSEYLATFDSQTMPQLRTRLARNDSDTFHHNGGHDEYHLLECRRWIYKTMLGMADLMERSSTNGYSADIQTERWYELHVWKMIDEYAMNHRSIQLLRGERSSSASSFRKNVYSRTAGDRKKMGRRVDGIFQTISDRLEIGGIELGSQDENRDGTKFSEDGLKLQKVLKDQFNFAFHHKPNIIKQEIEMLGLQLLGRSMQVISLDWVGGLFLRFRREDKTIMPASMEQFRDLLIGMAKIMLFFDRMTNNINKLNPTRTTSALEDILNPPSEPLQLSQEPPTATSP